MVNNQHTVISQLLIIASAFRRSNRTSIEQRIRKQQRNTTEEKVSKKINTTQKFHENQQSKNKNTKCIENMIGMMGMHGMEMNAAAMAVND